MSSKVLDVSSYQSTTYSTAGFIGVIVKATQGTSYINPKHDMQVARARAAGLVVGHYHFISGSASAQAQVDYFVKHAGIKAGDTLWLDWENSGTSCAKKDQFLKALKKAKPSNKVGLYCNTDYWTHRDTTSFCQDALWIAAYNGHAGSPGITHAWLLHQYTSSPVDTSYYAGTAAQLHTWAGSTPKPTPTEPTVDLSNAVAAAKADPKAAQGHQTHAADVKIIEAALKAEGYLAAKYATDGSYGSTTITAYSKWQKAYSKLHGLGWKGADVNGIPGMTSLKALGSKHGFKVKA